MLHYRISIPTGAGDGSPIVVLLHGRGSDEHDLMGLRPALPADAIVITPRAPFPGAPWGYGGGWAWYRILPDWIPEPEALEASIAAISELVERLPELLPVKPGPVIIGGFSQGSTTALAYALLHPDRVRGVLVFSGFLANHPDVLQAVANANGLPVFWGHGTADQMIPFELGVAGRSALSAAGAHVTSYDAPVGHGIDPRELAAASSWLAHVAVRDRDEVRS